LGCVIKTFPIEEQTGSRDFVVARQNNVQNSSLKTVGHATLLKQQTDFSKKEKPKLTGKNGFRMVTLSQCGPSPLLYWISDNSLRRVDHPSGEVLDRT